MANLTDIPRVGFHPATGYALDIEVCPAQEWLQRVPTDHFRYPSRLDFHQLILVTQGQFRHTVDFQLESAHTGALLAMRPGQVQRFEPAGTWDGWVLLFRPESFQTKGSAGALPPGLSIEDLPVQLTLDAMGFTAVQQALAQMHLDATMPGHSQWVNALERAQLQVVLTRLQLASAQGLASPSHDTSLAPHFRMFRHALEQRLHEWHHISSYANALGISEKTLGRATQLAAGLSAKAYLSKRLALEAKRLLAYTHWPIAQVADKLGFGEPTNFVKFFRREAGDTPSEFRKHHRD